MQRRESIDRPRHGAPPADPAPGQGSSWFPTAGPVLMSEAVQRCVRECTRCAGVCEESHRRGFDLIRQGRQDCAKATMMARDCADFCHMAIRMVLRCSDLMAHSLVACADACLDCIEACRRCAGGLMDRCIEACTECEGACRALCHFEPPRHMGAPPKGAK